MLRLRRAAAAALSALLLTGCGTHGGSDSGGGIPDDCGLPTPHGRRDESVLPPEFLVAGAQLVQARPRRGGVTASLNVPYSVADALELYRDAARAAGFELAGLDNEGFEAEVYLRRPGSLGAVQIRRSICDDASVVFVNVVSKRALRR